MIDTKNRIWINKKIFNISLMLSILTPLIYYSIKLVEFLENASTTVISKPYRPPYYQARMMDQGVYEDNIFVIYFLTPIFYFILTFFFAYLSLMILTTLIKFIKEIWKS